MESKSTKESACSIGQSRQSPILIIDDTTCLSTLPDIEFAYKTLDVDVKNYDHHTVKITAPATRRNPVDPMGSIVVPVNNTPTKYILREVHFHWRSEHKFKRTDRDHQIDYSMEMHLVHRLPGAEDCSRPFSCVVIGVWIDTDSLYPHNFAFAKIWERLPYLPAVAYVFNADELLPARESRSYYHYNGSLTTGLAPPFTPNVLWYMLKTPVQVSKGQLEQYLAVFPDRYDRPVQGTSDPYVLNQMIG